MSVESTNRVKISIGFVAARELAANQLLCRPYDGILIVKLVTVEICGDGGGINDGIRQEEEEEEGGDKRGEIA